jgi:photosystem II stability/assembly factor-like uncharacterized protein
MLKLNRGGVALGAFALLAFLGAVDLGSTSMVRPPPRPSATSRALDTPVLDHVPGAGPDGGTVSSLVVVATRPATLFAAFDQGGVFKSNDLGATWTPVDRGLPAAGSCRLVAVPANATTLYAECGYGLFKTTSSGALWQQLDVDDPRPPIVAPSNPDIVYQPPQIGVVRSRDGGRRWEQYGKSQITCGSFAVDPVDSSVLFCTDNEWLKQSRDGGLTWTSPARARQPKADVTALAIDPSDRTRMLAGTDDGRLFRTTSAGATWQAAAQAPAKEAIEDLQFVGRKGDVVFARQRSRIIRSVDGGDHWSALPGFVAELFDVFAVDPHSPSTVFVGSRDGVKVTTDFGQHWTDRRMGITRAVTSVRFHESPEGPVLHASSGGRIFESRDAGGTWTFNRLWRPDDAMKKPVVTPLESVPPSQTDFALRRSPFIVKTAQGFLYSVDGGSEWRSAQLPGGRLPSSIAVATGQPRIIYAATGFGMSTGSGIWRTLDGGTTWQLVDRPRVGGSTHCCELIAEPHDPNTIYAVMFGMVVGGGSAIEIRRTKDGGLTWTNLRSGQAGDSFFVLPTTPTTLLAHGYYDSDAPLLMSIDGGDQWSRAGAGLPAVSLTNIVADPRQPRHLFAGTNGRGVFRSTDAGASWQPTGRFR